MSVLGVKRLAVGKVLLALGIAICLACGGIQGLVSVVSSQVRTPFFWLPIAILWLVSVLENYLRQLGLLEDFRIWLVGHGHERMALALIPSILGILPSIGGVRFSCGVLDELSKGSGATAKQLALANFWFRHFHIFSNPLIPGTILAASITNLSLSELLVPLLPMTACTALLGWFFFIRPVSMGTCTGQKNSHTFASGWYAVLVAVWAVLCAFLNLPVLLFLAGSCAVAAIHCGLASGWSRSLAACIPSARDCSLWIDVAGVLLFAAALKFSNFNGWLLSTLDGWNLPIWFVLSLTVFILGLVTGVAQGYTALVMPLVATYYPGNASMAAFLLCLGFCSQFLTPSHLCLLVSCEYYKVRFPCLVAGLLVPLLASFAIWGMLFLAFCR